VWTMQELRPREDEDQPASCPNAPRTTQYVFLGSRYFSALC